MSRVAPDADFRLSRRERRAIKKALAFGVGLVLLWAVFGPVVFVVALAIVLILWALV